MLLCKDTQIAWTYSHVPLDVSPRILVSYYSVTYLSQEKRRTRRVRHTPLTSAYRPAQAMGEATDSSLLKTISVNRGLNSSPTYARVKKLYTQNPLAFIKRMRSSKLYPSSNLRA